jgi:hypothetical protein
MYLACTSVKTDAASKRHMRRLLRHTRWQRPFLPTRCEVHSVPPIVRSEMVGGIKIGCLSKVDIMGGLILGVPARNCHFVSISFGGINIGCDNDYPKHPILIPPLFKTFTVYPLPQVYSIPLYSIPPPRRGRGGGYGEREVHIRILRSLS